MLKQIITINKDIQKEANLQITTTQEITEIMTALLLVIHIETETEIVIDLTLAITEILESKTETQVVILETVTVIEITEIEIENTDHLQDDHEVKKNQKEHQLGTKTNLMDSRNTKTKFTSSTNKSSMILFTDILLLEKNSFQSVEKMLLRNFTLTKWS